MFGRRMLAVMLTIVMSGTAFAVVGCQAVADKAAEKTTEAIVENATGADVDIDENSVTIEGEDGSSVEIQSGEQLPEDYPSDAPVYDAAITSSGKISVDDSTSWSITQTTTDDFDGVVSDLRAQLADEGWEENGTTQTDTDGQKFAIIGASKGDSQCSISVQQSDGGDVEISITVNE